MEQQIDPKYLKQLSDDYELAMAKWAELYPETPIIRINGDKLNFVQNEKDLRNHF